MFNCNKCNKVIKNDKDYITCAGQCSNVFHNIKDCSGLSASAANYLTKYPNMLYVCNHCSSLKNGDSNESFNILDKQNEKLHSIKTDVKTILKSLEEQDPHPDYNDKFDFINTSLDKIYSKIKRLELDQQMLKDIKKTNDTLALRMQKVIEDYTLKSKHFESLYEKLDNLAVKIEAIPASFNNHDIFNTPVTFDTEFAILQINNKIDGLSEKLCPPVSLQTELENTKQISTNDAAVVKPEEDTSGWRFINQRSKRVWKMNWPKLTTKQKSRVNMNEKSNKFNQEKKNPNRSNLNRDRQGSVNSKKNNKNNINSNKQGNLNKKGTKTSKMTKNNGKNPSDIDKFDDIINEFIQSNNKYPNFVSGGIINPAQPPRTVPSFIDPLAPPKVKLTEKLSANYTGTDTNRYILSRFRDHKIYDKTRHLLAFFYDKKNDVCFKGLTKLNILMALKGEGLPIDINELQRLYFEYHASIEGIDLIDVENDLKTLRKQIEKERTNFLQTSSENYKKFYYPSHKKFFH